MFMINEITVVVVAKFCILADNLVTFSSRIDYLGISKCGRWSYQRGGRINGVFLLENVLVRIDEVVVWRGSTVLYFN